VKYCLLFEFILKGHLFLWIFSTITLVFSVTWSLRNHSLLVLNTTRMNKWSSMFIWWTVPLSIDSSQRCRPNLQWCCQDVCTTNGFNMKTEMKKQLWLRDYHHLRSLRCSVREYPFADPLSEQKEVAEREDHRVRSVLLKHLEKHDLKIQDHAWIMWKASPALQPPIKDRKTVYKIMKSTGEI